MAYGSIAGQLSFAGGGGNDYASAYQSALNMNKQNYNNILSGYQDTFQSQQQAQQKVLGGYGQLEGSVMGGLAGIDASQRQAINDEYAKNVGMESQRLISRGLGNSTVQQSVARGLMYDKAKSNVALTNATQGLYAQYQSQLGLARLGYEGQAAQQNTGFAKAQLDWMNSVNAGYPDANAYARLAQMKGASGAGAGFGTSPSIPMGSNSMGKAPGVSAPGYYGSGYGGSYGPARTSASGYGGSSETIYNGSGSDRINYFPLTGEDATSVGGWSPDQYMVGGGGPQLPDYTQGGQAGDQNEWGDEEGDW